MLIIDSLYYRWISSHEQVPVVHVCGKFIQYTSVQSRKDDQKNILSLNTSNFLFLAVQPCHRWSGIVNRMNKKKHALESIHVSPWTWHTGIHSLFQLIIIYNQEHELHRHYIHFTISMWKSCNFKTQFP